MSAAAAPGRPDSLLSVDDLKVRFTTEDGIVHAVDGVSFDLQPGEILGIVGESGSGKSVTAQTLMGLTRSPNAEITGSVRFHGADLVKASEEDLQSIRGREISMVFQDPMTSLNPVYRVGDQIVEQIEAHKDIPKDEAKQRAVELLASVGIPNADKRVDDYPYEFSGGMRQRAMIAMALALEPRILIADEPTTALDVTIQAQIMSLIQQLNEERGLSVILITHDLGVIAEVADRVLVMYAAQIVEEGSLDDIFYDPQHPYAWGLLGSLTRLDQPRPERLPQIAGQPPSLLAPPSGCRFRPRCPHAFEKCTELPGLEERLVGANGHADRCWLDPQDKRKLREVEGRIGLEVPEVVTQGSPDGARARDSATRDVGQGEPA
jgi:oligopeptide/dipeptide ABC transporter ATP-binding protein